MVTVSAVAQPIFLESSLSTYTSCSKAKNYLASLCKMLARNQIIDISDYSLGSPLLKLSPGARDELLDKCKCHESRVEEPGKVDKVVLSTKSHNRGLKITLSALKKMTDKEEETAVSIYKFILKKHLTESHLFEKEMTAAFSEYDYVIKFWGPLIEKVFKHSPIIPHWGDTVPNPTPVDGNQNENGSEVYSNYLQQRSRRLCLWGVRKRMLVSEILERQAEERHSIQGIVQFHCPEKRFEA